MTENPSLSQSSADIRGENNGDTAGEVLINTPGLHCLVYFQRAVSQLGMEAAYSGTPLTLPQLELLGSYMAQVADNLIDPEDDATAEMIGMAMRDYATGHLALAAASLELTASSASDSSGPAAPRPQPVTPHGGCTSRLLVNTVQEAVRTAASVPSDPVRSAKAADAFTYAAALSFGIDPPVHMVGSEAKASEPTGSPGWWESVKDFVAHALDSLKNYARGLADKLKAVWQEVETHWVECYKSKDWKTFTARAAAYALLAIVIVAVAFVAYDYFLGEKKYIQLWADFRFFNGTSVTPQSALALLAKGARNFSGVGLAIGAIGAAIGMVTDSPNALGAVRDVMSATAAIAAMERIRAPGGKVHEEKVAIRKVGDRIQVRHPQQEGSTEDPWHTFTLQGCCSPHVDELLPLIEGIHASEEGADGAINQMFAFFKAHWALVGGGVLIVTGLLTLWREQQRVDKFMTIAQSSKSTRKRRTARIKAKYPNVTRFRAFKDSPGKKTDVDPDELIEMLERDIRHIERVEAYDKDGNLVRIWDEGAGQDPSDLYGEAISDSEEEEAHEAELERRTGGDRYQGPKGHAVAEQCAGAFPPKPLDDGDRRELELFRQGLIYRTPQPETAKTAGAEVKQPQANKDKASKGVTGKRDPTQPCVDPKCPLYPCNSTSQRLNIIAAARKLNPKAGADLKRHNDTVWHWDADASAEKRAGLLQKWATPSPQAIAPAKLSHVRLLNSQKQHICSATPVFGLLLFPFHCTGAEESSRIRFVGITTGKEEVIMPVGHFKTFHKRGCELAYLRPATQIAPFTSQRRAEVPSLNAHMLTHLYNIDKSAYEVSSALVKQVNGQIITLTAHGSYKSIEGSCGGTYFPDDGEKVVAVHFAAAGGLFLGYLVPQAEELLRDWKEWEWVANYGGVSAESHWGAVVLPTLDFVPRQ